MEPLVNVVLLAERMHWTLDYVKAMDSDDYAAVREILRAKDTADGEIAMRGF